MKRSFATLGIATVGVLTAALCTSCNSSGSTSSSAARSTGSSAADHVAGGTKADSSKSSVLVGFENLEGGTTFSLPNAREGFEAGIDYVNSELGGINGHPLKAVECKSAGTPDAAVACGNQFVQNKVVLSVLGTDFSADAALPVLKSGGIVTLGSLAFTPGLNTAVGSAYMDYYASQEGFAANLVNAKNADDTTIAEIYPDQPAQHTIVSKTVQPIAKKLGVRVKAYYYPAQTDWTSLATTVLASNPQAVDLYTSDADCLPAVPALRAAGFTGIIQTQSCQSLQQRLSASALKDVYFGSPLYSPSVSPLPAKVASDVSIYNSYMKKDASDFGKPGFSNDQGQQGFFLAVQAASHLTQIKASSGDSISAADVKAGMGTTKGSLFFRTTSYDCSTPSWPGTTACAQGLLYFKENSDKSLVAVSGKTVDVSTARPSR